MGDAKDYYIKKMLLNISLMITQLCLRIWLNLIPLILTITILGLVKKALDMKLGKVTKSDVVKMCPLLSLSSIEKVLARMVEEGKLEKGGSGKNSFYIIKL